MMSELDLLRKYTTVDLDCLDATVPAQHSSFKFQDCTSNQAILLGQLQSGPIDPVLSPVLQALQQDDVVRALCNEAGKDGDLAVALDLLVIDYQSTLLPQLAWSGRVHVQTSPQHAFDLEATIHHARRIVQLFRHRHGIQPSQICIKIPATFQGLQACRVLEQEGIATLATILFTEAQATLAHEVRCTYIAPYINELQVHFTPGYIDPCPNFQTVERIHRLYSKVQSETRILPASLTQVEEVARLRGIEHITVSPALLATLAKTPAKDEAETGAGRVFASIDRTGNAAALPVSYLAEEAAFERDNRGHAEHNRKFDEALEIFCKAEADIYALIRAGLLGKDVAANAEETLDVPSTMSA